MLFAGRERELLGDWAFPSMTAVQGAITDDDVAEFARTYARPDGWRGAEGLYRSMLAEGDEIKALANARPLTMPVLAVGAGGGPFTLSTVSQVAAGQVASVQLDGVGHYAALEAPDALSTAILDFLATVDAAGCHAWILGQGDRSHLMVIGPAGRLVAGGALAALRPVGSRIRQVGIPEDNESASRRWRPISERGRRHLADALSSVMSNAESAGWGTLVDQLGAVAWPDQADVAEMRVREPVRELQAVAE